jgi:hypothetical protein
MNRCLGIALAVALGSVSFVERANANTRVCVNVEQKSWYKAPQLEASPPVVAPVAAPAPAAAPGGALLQPVSPVTGPIPPPVPPPVAPPPRPSKTHPNTHEIDPTLYLKRMLEYEVTHEPGFAAVDTGCTQRLTVELYQLESGWTVFARYSGTEREEKVDHAEVDEFTQLAQRIGFALLRSQPISQTITRENVLRADSEMNLRTINGTGHLLFGMGTAVRVARLPTAQGQAQAAADELRLLTPISIQVAYRRKLRAWGLDAFGRLNLGTESTGIHSNDLGGHADYAAGLQAGLHFFRYTDPAGVNSLYFGGGAAFEVDWFEMIRPLAARTGTDRDTLTGGGLNLDLLVGYEFLRASSVHFFGQLELEAPTYLINAENDSGSINTYMPGALAQIGIIF